MKAQVAIGAIIGALLAINMIPVGGIALSSRSTAAPAEISFMVAHKGKYIKAFSIKKQVETELYGISFNLQNEGTVSVSPDDSLCAFIEVEPGNFATEESGRQGIYDTPPIPYLRIIDAAGRLCRTITGVQRYAWNPSGDCIAYITYDMKDADYPYRYPTGLWVYELTTDRTTKLLDKASYLYWATHDKCLYISCIGVPTALRWNPSTGIIDTTEFNDIYFSPDGKYYLRLWKDEFLPIQLFESASNRFLYAMLVYKRFLPVDSIVPEGPSGIGGLALGGDVYPPYGWVFGSGHYLLFTKIDATTEEEERGAITIIKSQTIHGIKHSIYDPEKGKVIKQFEGPISSWVGDGSRIIVERNGKVEFVEKPE